MIDKAIAKGRRLLNMKKKGFTLVELLAVIAILAILVIMALPAVLRMYREARQSTFVEEVQGTYKMAQTQYVQDVTTGNGLSTFTYTNCSGDKTLPMTTSNNFKYTVTINGDSKITELKASNGAFKYEYSGSGITAEDLAKTVTTGGNTTTNSKYSFDASSAANQTFNICP